MKISIITPCTRIENLPVILSSIELHNGIFEWIIVYDGKIIKNIDDRILTYKKSSNVDIKLLIDYNNNPNTGKAWYLRNIGIKNATGDYLYFLDDDNLLHWKFYPNVMNSTHKLVLLNLVMRGNVIKWKQDRANIYDIIDTAQFFVRKDVNALWGPTNNYIEEEMYKKNIFKEINIDKDIKIIYDPCCYYNYLRHGN